MIPSPVGPQDADFEAGVFVNPVLRTFRSNKPARTPRELAALLVGDTLIEEIAHVVFPDLEDEAIESVKRDFRRQLGNNRLRLAIRLMAGALAGGGDLDGRLDEGVSPGFTAARARYAEIFGPGGNVSASSQTRETLSMPSAA